MSFKLPSSAKDIESAQWHYTMEHNFIVSTESGMVFGFDTRKFKEPVFSFQAHTKACSHAAFSPHVPNMMATVGTDKLCKIWDISQTNESGKLAPKCVAKKDMEQGQLFSVQFYEDIPFVLAAGGQKGEVAIWDTEEDKSVKTIFRPFLSEAAITLKKNADRGVSSKEKQVDEEGSSSYEDVESD